MNAIVAVDANWAIGNKGSLLVSIPSDQKNFRNYTTGKVIVLGRKTLETFPQKQPLKNRTNIILTHDPNYKAGDAVIVHSHEELMEELKKYPSEDIYIIGGDSIYKQYVPLCDTAIVTKIDRKYESDAYFPNLDEDPEWELVEEGEEQTYFDVEFCFCTYRRKA